MDPSAQTSTRCVTCFAELTSAESCPACAGQGTSRSSLLALPAGVLLAGQYRVGQVLGQPGGFGITYLAWDEKLETRVAIKEFFPRELAGRGTDRATIQPHTETDGSTFEYGLARFLEEARTLARFDHPNIVRVRNFFEANGTGYLVMDYYEGESLSAYLARQPGERLDEQLAIGIMLPVLDGLRAVHAQGILHRDIDPHNIYLTTHGRVILLDFGAARVAIGDRIRSLSVILKPGYAPYEQYASTGKQGPWTDVYACAATLYRMVTGRVPVDAPSRILEDSLVPPHKLRPELPRHLSDAVLAGLAVRPTERPRTVQEFQELILGEQETATPTPMVEKGGREHVPVYVDDPAEDETEPQGADGAMAAPEPVRRDAAMEQPVRSGGAEDTGSSPQDEDAGEPVSTGTPDGSPGPDRSRALLVGAAVAVVLVIFVGLWFGIPGGDRGSEGGGTSLLAPVQPIPDPDPVPPQQPEAPPRSGGSGRGPEPEAPPPPTEPTPPPTPERTAPRVAVIMGQVRDRDTGRPIGNASVVLQGTQAGGLTNADGRFRLTDPPQAAEYTVQARHLGYRDATITAAAADTVRVDIIMAVESVALEEIVVQGVAEPGEPSALASSLTCGSWRWGEDLSRGMMLELERELDASVHTTQCGGTGRERSGSRIPVRLQASRGYVVLGTCDGCDISVDVSDQNGLRVAEDRLLLEPVLAVAAPATGEYTVGISTDCSGTSCPWGVAVLAVRSFNLPDAQEELQQATDRAFAENVPDARLIPVVPVRMGHLRHREASAFQVRFREGGLYFLLGVCDEACRALELMVEGPNGQVVGSYEGAEATTPMVLFEARVDALHEVEADMSCESTQRLRTCAYSVGVWEVVPRE